MNISKTIQQLAPRPISADNFHPYGQVIFPSQDGKPYDALDAQLILDRGTPHFYIMQLHGRGMRFHEIERHLQSTQCLGSLEGKEWLIAVCPPNNELDVPNLADIVAFRVPGNCFIKLNLGTWHAGPYFESSIVNFYNLELSDTNVVDRFTHNSLTSRNLEFEFVIKN